EMLEPVPVLEATVFPVEEVSGLQPFPPQSPLPRPRTAKLTGQLVSTLPSRDLALDAALTRRDDRTTADVSLSPALPSPISDLSMKFVAARPGPYPGFPQTGLQPAKLMSSR